MTTQVSRCDKSPEVLDFDLNPIISSIEDVLKRQLTANLNGIQKKYSHYLDAYHSIKSLPFIVELTEANERLRKKLEESESIREEVIHRKNEIESHVQELEQQLESANKMVKALADKLTGLEPHNIFLEIASNWPTKARSDSEVDDLLERLYSDLGIDDEDSEVEEAVDEMQVCSKDIKEMLKELRESTDDNHVSEQDEDKADQVRVVKINDKETFEEYRENKEEVNEDDHGNEMQVSSSADGQVKHDEIEEEEVDEEEEVEEEEVEEEEVEEEEEEEEDVEEEEVEEEEVEEEDVEEEDVEEEEDDDEVFEVEVEGNKYFASGTENGLIFEYVDEDTMGKQIGIFKNSQAIFN